MRLRVTWGNLPHMGDHPDRLLCFACDKELPTWAAVQCGECAHAWRWRWLLSLHDWVVCLRFRIWVLPRIPSRVWVCPCCMHDL